MIVKMGRPREHGALAAAALLGHAERIVEAEGVDALSVRRVAHEAGTTTRAVYSLFASKDGLVAALGARAFGLLGAAVEALPATDDPVADLVEAGAVGFRSFVLGHPALFRVAVQHIAVTPEIASRFRPAAQASLAHLERRIARLDEAGLLGGRSVHDAACQFHALCEGLAALELRGVLIPDDAADRVWHDALAALATGFAAALAAGEPRSPRRRPSIRRR